MLGLTMPWAARYCESCEKRTRAGMHAISTSEKKEASLSRRDE
jgi:hypothetical protein